MKHEHITITTDDIINIVVAKAFIGQLADRVNTLLTLSNVQWWMINDFQHYLVRYHTCVFKNLFIWDKIYKCTYDEDWLFRKYGSEKTISIDIVDSNTAEVLYSVEMSNVKEDK